MPWVTSAAPAPLSPDTLADHARHFQRLIWWRNARESLAAAVVITANLGDLRDGPVGLEWMSHALLIVGALCVMAFTHTGAASRVVPNGLPPDALLRFHRDEIVRQQRVLRAVPVRYLGPLVPGMLLSNAARWSTRPSAAVSGLSVVVLILAFVWWINIKAGHSLARQAVAVEALGRHFMSIVSLSDRWLMSGLLVLAVSAGGGVTASGQSASPQERVSDAEIARILAERIDTQRQSVGIVVGVLEPGGRRVISHGSATKGEARRLDGETVFEIGSITKVFTALLLADAVERGEVALTEPVAKFLPASVRVPERGRAITLVIWHPTYPGCPACRRT